MKKIFTTFFISLFLLSCGETNKVATQPGEVSIQSKKQVIASIFPLASIADYIAGDYIDVANLVPVGVSPHGFDLTTNHMIDINNADLIIDLDFEHIDGFLKKALEGKNRLIVSQDIPLISTEKDEHHEDEHHEDEHHEDEHHEDEHHEDEHNHSSDPHIWTSPENAKKIAKKIQNQFAILEPEYQVEFQKNYDSFVGEIDTLTSLYKTKIAGKTQQESIIFHDAYNYLFRELGVDKSKIKVFRLSVLSDPNSRHTKELIDFIKEYKVETIFREPQFQRGSFDTFATQYNLQLAVLDPQGKGSYLETLKNNLENLSLLYK